MIIDLHLDLAWDALFWNRDLTLTAQDVRRQEEEEEPQVASDYNTGICTVTFPEMRRGSRRDDAQYHHVAHGTSPA